MIYKYFIIILYINILTNTYNPFSKYFKLQIIRFA